jgi:hypothetical protein
LDGHGGGEIFFHMYRVSSPASFPLSLLTGLSSTGVAATPGCAIFPNSLIDPFPIDNKKFGYFLTVTPTLGAGSLNFSAVRVYYTLQVSPAPAAASFTDVPTSHPFFQWIEALVASGITVGCGGGNYCPDAPLTRGQMAVFLSKALGCTSRRSNGRHPPTAGRGSFRGRRRNIRRVQERHSRDRSPGLHLDRRRA